MQKNESHTTIDKVRQLVGSGVITKAAIARASGLHANTLRDCDQPHWNPTADTLAKLEGFLSASDETPVMVGPEELIEEARNGRMFILVDDEDRENEGDLVIPAQMSTPAAINFMATHGRGLICLAMTKDRAETLELEMMSRDNRTRHETAFTTSIEAREGVTTGISASDRARTISVAIDPTKTSDDIVTPGHVFPLIARNGGVLTRAGHTEAAVDIARLAGLNPAGVICEIMNEDGTMARMEDLIAYARRHELKIGTIRDLIAYRRRNDRLIERTTQTRFRSRWGGDWTAISFTNTPTGDDMLALVLGDIKEDEPTLVRMHTLDPFADVFNEDGPRAGVMQRSMELIAQEGTGIIVLITRTATRQVGTMIEEKKAEQSGEDTESIRNYGIGAQILTELGVHDMILLTNSHHTLVALEGYGLSVVGQRPIDVAQPGDKS